MEARIARLEDDSKEMRSDMKKVLADLAYLKGKIENVPTVWTLITTMIGGQVTLVGLIAAVVFGLSRFLGHG